MLPDDVQPSPDIATPYGFERRWLRLSLWSLVAAPVILAATLIARFGVDLCRQDELIIGNLLLALQKSGLTFDQLISQANESRLLFPRLISVGLALLTHFDTRYEMWLTLLLMLANLAMMVALYRRATRGTSSSPLLLPLLAAGASVIIFSPFQTQLVWGFIYLNYIPVVCLLASLLIGGSGLGTPLRHILPVLLCIIATFSFANGMITWLLVPAFLAGSGLFSGRRLPWLALWIAVAAASFWLYFHGYQRPGYHPSLLAFRGQELLTIVAFFSFFGGPLGSGAPGTPVSLLVPAAVGLVIVLATLLSLARLARNHHFRIALPWGILFAYVAASAAITTLGRIGFGAHAMTASRYAAYNTYAIAALFFLIALAWQFAPWRGSWRRAMQVACALLVLAFLGLWACSLGDNINAIRHTARVVTHARAAMPYYEQMPSVSGSLDSFAKLSRGVRHTKPLRDLGYVRPAPVTPETYNAALSRESAGFVEQLAVDGVQASTGWADIPHQHRPADAVVITRKSADGQRMPISVCLPAIERPDVAKRVGKKNGKDYGWTLILPAAPSDLLEAWAVDGSTGTLYPLVFAQQAPR